MFAASIGVKDANEAEFIAIVFALEMSLQQDWMKEMEIIVEFDSKNALAWVNRKKQFPWSLRFFCNRLKNIILVLKQVSFIHKNREANFLADSLAKEGSQMEGMWPLWT